jgi:hypothetical protein
MPKTFFDRGREYLEKQKLMWLQSVIGTELEPCAIQVAQENNWIMPGEGLECATVDAMFRGHNLSEISTLVKTEEIDEREGSKRVAANVALSLNSIRTLLNSKTAKEGVKVTHSKPPSATPTSDAVTITGIPECRGKNTVVLYGFVVDGKDVFAFKDDALSMMAAVDGKKPVTLTCHQSRWWCVAEDVKIGG